MALGSNMSKLPLNKNTIFIFVSDFHAILYGLLVVDFSKLFLQAFDLSL